MMQSALNVIPAAALFTSRSAPQPAQLAPDATRRDRRYDFNTVVHKLGLDDNRAPRTTIDTIRSLVDRNGFPPPVTVRLCHGVRVTGGKAVTRRSQWDADAVDDWLESALPPAAAQSRDMARHGRSRVALADRAQALVQ